MKLFYIKIAVSLLFVLCLLFTNKATGQCYSTDGNKWNESWTSCQMTMNPNNQRGISHWILFEFETPQSIADSWIWNANLAGQSNLGARDIVVDYSSDGAAWTELGTYTLPKASEQANYQGVQGPDFAGVFIKEILITILNTHGNNSCASLAEIQFNIDQTACYGTLDACGVCNGPGAITWYRDADSDGLGDPNDFIIACTQPSGYIATSGDDCDNGLPGWDEIGAIFADNGCNACHGPAALGGLRLDSYDTFLQGGDKCGTAITTGTTLIDIINTNNYAGCGTTIAFPSMNQRVGGAIDNNEIARIQEWINTGASQNCNCPNVANIALAGTPAMSSSYFSNSTALLNDGIINNNSLAHTNGESPNDWVEIDLEAIQDIENVVIWNRTNCCGDRLNNVYVLVSNTPFPANTDLNASLANADFTYQMGNVANDAMITVNVGQSGRYVRLQKSGNNTGGNFINILELQVFLEGNFSDLDGDGLCDEIDNCPGFDNSLIGTACNDGNPCTENDIWNSQCECIGKPKDDSDLDGICDDADVMPNDPCTADGIIDGNEPSGFITNISNDCDGDFITLLEGDLDDFDACINDTGASTNPECKCPGNEFSAAGTIVANTDGVSDIANAEGLPDGDYASMTTGETITYEFPNLDISAEICFHIGFSQPDASATIDINYYPYTYINPDPSLPAYEPQEFCIRTDIPGTQTVIITARSRTISIDGTTFQFCNCTDLDPTYNPQTAGCTLGEPCDDGNYCTSNDQYDCDCNCIGRPTDTPLANAPCTVGAPCDDGDACTVNDTYDCECNCTGEYEGYEVVSGVGIDIGSGGGETFMVGADNIVYQWDQCTDSWSEFSSSIAAERIDVQGNGTPWITATNKTIHRWNGSAFVQTSGLAIDIGINGNHIFHVGTNNDVYRWNGSSWNRESNIGIAWRIDARPNGDAIVISLDSLNHWHQGGQLQSLSKGDFKAIDAVNPIGGSDYYCLSKEGIIHQYMGGGNYAPVGGWGGINCTMGSNGEIWLTQSNQMLRKRRCNQIQQEDFVSTACDDGIACTSSIYTDNCNTCESGLFFSTVAGRGKDIGSGGGETYVIGMNDYIYKWNNCTESWSLFSNMLSLRIDADGNSMPWIIAKDNTIHRWDGNAFIQMPGTALDIGINGNHIFIAGTDNNLYKWNGSNWDALDSRAPIIRVDATNNGEARAIGIDYLNYSYDGNTLSETPKGTIVGVDVSVPEGSAIHYTLTPTGSIYEYAGGDVYNFFGGIGGVNFTIRTSGDYWMTLQNNHIQRTDDCASISVTGTACNDGDDCTENDVYNSNCDCAGTLIDQNNDGICDISCIDIQLSAWLEGAYNPTLGKMTTTLSSSRKLLPGQTPVNNLATPTPAGQPYHSTPWNYNGTEGIGWTNADYTGNETDWVLVSFRTGTAKSTEIAMTAGLLMKDGVIELPDRCALPSNITSSLYIVVEHRNHIGIMTPQPVDIIGGILAYDFRVSDSYRDQTSFGQKQLPTGEWVMFAGDANQIVDLASFDVNGTDKTEWFNNNGVFDYYLSPDFNLDGDTNGEDKLFWFDNNGVSSRVPK